MAHDIVFQGLTAPLRIDGADHLLDLLPDVVPGLPHDIRPASPGATPFFSIRAAGRSGKVLSQNLLDPDKKPRRLNPVNALCDMVAALGNAIPAEDDALICLHAAGVAMSGALVIFPNIRRAGKSTLSAALAWRGYEVFSDDVIPVSFDAAGRAFGQAMGAAPRLRLPLPESLAPGLRDWVARNPGPENRQYKYLRLDTPTGAGRRLPIGAFVILDRQDSPTEPRLDPVTPDAAMDVLLHQNFTRDRHSADVLAAIAETLRSRPAHRLVFSEPVAAAACLGAAFAAGMSDAAPPRDPPRRFRMADLDARATPVLTAEARIRRHPGTAAEVIGSTLYLSDARGRAIHRMDPLATAIWDILAEPIARADLEAVLTEAFPQADPARIAADLTALLTRIAAAGLIETAPPEA